MDASRLGGLLLLLLVLPHAARGQRIFAAETGEVTFPKDVEDPKYLVQMMEPGDADAAADGPPDESRVVYMTSKDGQRYQCVLPEPEPEPESTGDEEASPHDGGGGSGSDQQREARRAGGEGEGSQQARGGRLSKEGSRHFGGGGVLGARKSPEQLLDVLKDVAGVACFQRLEGWWTYEFCYKKHVRQFHQDAEKVVSQEFKLGLYNDGATKLRHQESEAFLQKDPRSQTAAQRYHVHSFTDGTLCDLTGTPRETEVRFFCSEDPRSYIASINEEKTCSYVLIFYTSLLCKHQLFRSEEKPPSAIECTPISPDSTPSDSPPGDSGNYELLTEQTEQTQVGEQQAASDADVVHDNSEAERREEL